MARYITFRFDDGFIEGARKASAILHPSRATFFLITGQVIRSIRVDSDPAFRDRDFGTIEEWRAVSSLGHDVQLHSVSHQNFRKLCEEQQKLEVLGSLAVIREIHSGPFVFAFPYNAISDLDLCSLGMSAGGFLTDSSDQDVLFNNVEGLESNLFRLRSWAVRERHYQKVVDQLARVPENTWTILAFHSLDGEGHEPWTSEGFARLVQFVRAGAFRIVSVAGALQVLTQREVRTDT